MHRSPPTIAALHEFLARAESREPWHHKRYVTTFVRAWPTARDAQRILDVGGRSPFTGMLEKFTSASVTCDSYDLRERFPYSDGMFDVAYCLEVIEHVKDRDSTHLGTIATFTSSGINNCLAEIRRVLKPGGVLVLSTPNVASLRSLRNVLGHRHPFAFPLHHRELAITDVERLLSEAGFSIEELTTINAWYNGGGWFWQLRLMLLLLLSGHSLRNRSDDIIALARRPSA